MAEFFPSVLRLLVGRKPDGARPDALPPEPYRVFTRVFDREVRESEIDTVLGAPSSVTAAALDEAWRELELALQGWRTIAELSAIETGAAVRKVTTDAQRADTVVTLLVDHSGSMKGQNILLAAGAVDIAQDFLRHLGCKVEVLGFTTSRWRGGKSRERWVRQGRPAYPGRLCDLLHIIYRDADDARTSSIGWGLRTMLRRDLLKENVDGDAVEWAAARLRARPETRKVLLVISDGAPVDDSTLQANDNGYLDRRLIEVVDALDEGDDIEVAAVGISFDVSRYYRRSVVLETPEELGTEVIDLLGHLLTRPREERNRPPP